MDKQNLIIFKFKFLYEIIKELEENLNFRIIEANNEKVLNEKSHIFQNNIIVTQKNMDIKGNQFILNQIPIKLYRFIEKLNIQFLKLQYNEKSELSIGLYKIDLNSRELIAKNLSLKLTEKETNIIIYLSKSNKAVGVNQLQSEVWGYHSKLETHTVETHIYRLRKKILKNFNDNNFIVSKKNGYQIN
jgi:DNA-binding response OmpR family regulator